jgi:peptidoglycan/LPS O-acetylase OafA/YrhL
VRPVERFYSLDVLRGLAALCVVLWHWQFFFSNDSFDAGMVHTLPLGHLLEMFYLKGWRAVDLFFGLSGFVFYWLYSQQIAERRISGLSFAALRFSRLYPLHLATLLFVGAMELVLIGEEGAPVGVEHIDLPHFMVQLFLMSTWVYWRIDDAMSFNDWSVSVETFLYTVLFLSCRFLPVRMLTLAGLSALGFFIGQKVESALGRGMGSFFLGGCVYFLYCAIARSPQFMRWTVWTVAWTVSLWIFTLAYFSSGVDLAALASQPRLHFILERVVVAWPVLVLFPLTILSLALCETARGSLGKRISFIGDVSYAAYMLGFPLQLVFYFVLKHVGLGMGAQIYRSGGFMLAFFALLIWLSLLSHRHFEMPLQKILRRALTRRRAPAPT